MPHQDKSQKCYLDLGINLEWPNSMLNGSEIMDNILLQCLVKPKSDRNRI